MKIIQNTKKENYEKNNLSGIFYLIGGKDKDGDSVIIADSFNVYDLEKHCKKSFKRLLKERTIRFI